MKKIYLYLFWTLVSSTLLVFPTSCEDDEAEEPEVEDVRTQVTKSTLEGGWTHTVSNSQTYYITKGDDGMLPNSKGEWKSTYYVMADYMIFHDGITYGFVQYFNGIYGRGSYYIDLNRLVYGGKATISPTCTSPMKPNVQNIEIMSYKYDKSKNLLTSTTMIVPSISRSEMTFVNQLEKKTVIECYITPNVKGKTYYYETWEEDEDGNIINYIDHGDVSSADRFLVFTDELFVRATEYGNKNALYGSYDTSDKSVFLHSLVWD